MTAFEGIWVPMVTPFNRTGLDIPAAQKLAAYLIEQGVDGLVICGTTGEAATLNDSEQTALLEAVLEVAGTRCPVVFGIAGNDTAQVTSRVHQYTRHPLSGFLITAPYYLRPSQAGIRQHFEAAANATHLPIVIYNIPYRTGVNIEISTLQALSENRQFVAIKESGGGNFDQLTQLITDTPLNVLSGEDALIFITSCLGGHGAVSAAAHIRPDLYKRMLNDINNGNLIAARKIETSLRPLIKALFSEPNPAPLKAALSHMGLIENNVRLPMLSVSMAYEKTLTKLIDNISAIP